MTENCARSILRLISVVIIMVGLCMAAYMLIGFIGASRASQSMSGMLSDVQVELTGALAQFGFVALVADLAVSGLGLALFVLSPRLAAKIVD